MKKTNVDAAVGKKAQQQFGLITRAQALELGVSRAGILRRRTAKKWETVCLNVYRLAGVPVSDQQRLLGVCLSLGPDAVASHASAAHLWALDGFTRTFPRPFEVSVPHGCWRKLRGVVVHQRRDLVLEGAARFGEIPATGLARTLVDLAGALDAPTFEVAFDSAWRKTPGLAAMLDACFETLEPRGRRGLHVLTGLIRNRQPRPTDSAHEVDVLRAIRRARLPPPKLQHEISDSVGRIARADFAWVDQRVVLFADGWAFHGNRPAFDRDREQRERLSASGWTPVVVTPRLLERGSWLRSLKRHLRKAS